MWISKIGKRKIMEQIMEKKEEEIYWRNTKQLEKYM